MDACHAPLSLGLTTDVDVAQGCLDHRRSVAIYRSMTSPDDRAAKTAQRKPLSPAAERALAEAATRRAESERKAADRAGEVGGPSGPEPTRYGDWEKKGLTSDF
jgi:hypothetical protein